MALLGIPFFSSLFGHAECHITCGLSSTLAPQQSSECLAAAILSYLDAVTLVISPWLTSELCIL